MYYRLWATACMMVAASFACRGQWVLERTPTTSAIYDIHFMSAQSAFLGTSQGIHKTIDGGVTWTRPSYPTTADDQLLAGAFVNDIWFADQNTGFFAGTGMFNTVDVIAKTTDGGASWRVVYARQMGSAVGRLGLQSLTFTNASVGFAVGGNGVRLLTNDGGNSWADLPGSVSANLNKVVFTDAQTGLMAGDKTLLRTTDGGASWTSLTTSFNIKDIYFFDAGKGVASTFEGKVLNTANGGVTWTESIFTVNGSLGKIAFQGQTGYITVYSTIFNLPILKTTDGGGVWERQDIAGDNLLFGGIAISPAGRVFTGDYDGKLRSSGLAQNEAMPIPWFTAPSGPFCFGSTYTFTNNGPADTYRYEWRLNGNLAARTHHYNVALSPGRNEISLRAIKGTLSDTKTIVVDVENRVYFTYPDLRVTHVNEYCAGQRAVFTVKSPETARYELYQDNVLVHTVTQMNTEIVLQSPILTGTGSVSFRVLASKSNSCQTVTAAYAATVSVYGDLRAGSSIPNLQQHICNAGKPSLQITASKAAVTYDLYQGQTLLTSLVGNGGMLTFDAPLLRADAAFRIKARTGSCEQWFDETVTVDVETVTANFHLSHLNFDLNDRDEVRVYNRSTGATTYQWTFPGAQQTSSTLAAPVPVKFTQAGNQEVRLRASAASGCADTLTKILPVYNGNTDLKQSCWAVSIGLDNYHDGGTEEKDKYTASVAPNGDVLITGLSETSMEFDSKIGNDYTLPVAGGIPQFLARYSSQGVLKWAVTTSGHEGWSSSSVGSRVAASPDGSIYVLARYNSWDPVFYSTNGEAIRPFPEGYTWGTSAQQHLIKYSADGMVEWVRSGPGIRGRNNAEAGEEFYKLEVGPSGMVYVVSNRLYMISPAGDVLSDSEFMAPSGYRPVQAVVPVSDGVWCIFPGVGFDDGIIRKYTNDGRMAWQSTYSGMANYAVADEGDNVYMATGFAGTGTFASRGDAPKSITSSSFVLVRYNSEGKVEWLNGSTGEDVMINAHGLVRNEDEVTVAFHSYKDGATLLSADGHNRKLPRWYTHLARYDADGNIRAFDRVGDDVEHEYAYAGVFNIAGTGPVYVYGAVQGPPVMIHGDPVYAPGKGSFYVASFGRDCDMVQPGLFGDVDVMDGANYFCPGTTLEVKYEIRGIPLPKLAPDNVFEVYMVDDYGGRRKVGSLATTEPQGVIQVTLPVADTNVGYHLRIWGTNPRLYSDVAGDYFSMLPGYNGAFTYESRTESQIRFSLPATAEPGYEWTINGTTTTEASPTYTFPGPGKYTVCLRSTGGGACKTDTNFCREMTIYCSPVWASFTTTAQDRNVTFKASTSPSSYVVWDFGDGTTSTQREVKHTFSDYGNYNVCVTASSGCLSDTECKQIAVTCAQAPLGFGRIIAGTQVTFFNQSPEEYISFTWDFGDGTTSSEKNPVHVYAQAGNYLITLSGIGKCGTVSSMLGGITITAVIPSAPTSLVVTGTGTFAVALRWTDNATNEQGYRIEYLPAGSSTYVYAGTVSANIVEYTVNGLTCLLGHTFRVQAVGVGANSAYSNTVQTTTAGLLPPDITASAKNICEGETATLAAPSYLDGFLWSTGETTREIVVTRSGTYTVRGITAGCVSPPSPNVKVVVNPIPEVDIELVSNQLRATITADQYQWYLNDEALTDGRSQTLLPSVAGNYRVEVISKGCTGISRTVNLVITAEEQAIGDQLRVYPSPASDFMTIQFDKGIAQDAAQVTLMNTVGSRILTASKPVRQQELTLDVSHVTPGVYICLIETGGKVIRQKITIR